MKKLAVFLLTFFLLIGGAFSFTGCGLLKTDTDAAENNLEKLIGCIQERNVEDIKSLFAANRISDIENFENDIQELLNCYKGEFISHDFDMPATENDSHNGKRRKWFIIGANILTTEAKYRITLYWCDLDDTDSRNVGIWSMYLFNYEDNPLEDYSFYGTDRWGNAVHNGIHIVKPYKYAEMTLNIIESGNIDYIKLLFSTDVINSGAFEESVSELKSYYNVKHTESTETASKKEEERGENGQVKTIYEMRSYEVKTESGNYYVAVKYCDKSEIQENTGIRSLYLWNAEDKPEDINLNNLLWIDGIHVGEAE